MLIKHGEEFLIREKLGIFDGGDEELLIENLFDLLGGGGAFVGKVLGGMGKPLILALGSTRKGYQANKGRCGSQAPCGERDWAEKGLPPWLSGFGLRLPNFS